MATVSPWRLLRLAPWLLAACTADNNIVCLSGTHEEDSRCVPDEGAAGQAGSSGQAGVSGQAGASGAAGGALAGAGGEGGGAGAAGGQAGASGEGGAGAAGAGQGGEAGQAGAGQAGQGGAGQAGQAGQAGAGQAGQGGAGQAGQAGAGQAGQAGAGQAGSGGSGQSDEVVCATASENEDAKIDCGSGRVVKSVTFASYGTPTGDCEGFAKGGCHADTSEAKVKEACLGKQSCTVNAGNGTFGEPCEGQGKNLRVQVVCGKP